MADQIYTAAVVGLGRIGWRFDEDPRETCIHSHAGAYAHSDRFKLVSAADVSESARSAFGHRYPDVRTYASADALLAAGVPDCLSIATHADSHLPLVRAAVAAGVRAIWCEKPVAPTLHEGEAIVDCCRSAGVVLAVNHWRRWDTTHRNIERWLRSRAIGDVRQVICYYGAGIWNTGIHLFDLLEQWFGPVAWLQSSEPLEANAADPDLDIMGGFEQGGRFACRALPVKQEYLMFSMDIFGSQGRLEVMTNADALRVWRAVPSPISSEYRVLTEVDETIPREKREFMMNTVADVARCLDGGCEPACGGEAALRALQCVLAAVRSSQTQQVVELRTAVPALV
jgi:predicted dehydrogenase